MKFNRAAFFSLLRAAFPGKLSQGAVDGLGFLLAAIEADNRLTDLRWIAYILATTYHETAGTYQPIEERGARSYFDKYEPGTKLGKALGNTQKGDGWLMRGRGYVQLTGRSNYRKFLVDLEPDRAKEPATAYKVMVRGMTDGMFTGKKLRDYFNSKQSDWFNARRIINGTDRAELIAGYARKLHEVLSGALEPCDVEVEA